MRATVDPVHGPVSRPQPADGAAARRRYLAVADPEVGYGAADDLCAELLATGDGDRDLAAAVRQTAAWAEEERQRIRTIVRAAQTTDPLVQRAALSAAPLALMSGAWLGWLSAPGNSHEELVLAVLALYASDLGVGRPRASRGDACLDLLRRLRLAEHAVPAARLVHDARVPDAAFKLPATLLAMGRRPGQFAAEVLGADLCLRAVGLTPPLAAALEAADVQADWSALDPADDRDAEPRGGLPQCQRAVELFLQAAPAEQRSRLHVGFAWARAAARSWVEQLREDLAALDPAREMAELLRLRAREGAVYHETFLLAGRSLSSWLEQAREDPQPLMHALAASDLVRPGHAEASPLITGLVGERGPMYRVFAGNDLAVIRRWVDTLAPMREGGGGGAPPPRVDGRPEAAIPSARAAAETPRRVAPPSDPNATERPARVTLREAYHLLQRRACTPGLLRWAASYVHGWHARARLGVGVDARQPPARWTSAGLRPWLLDQHDRHANQFSSDAAPPATREAVIESTVQMAPLTLIDGAWLQGFTDYQHASTEVGHFLFDTYWDELGNGKTRLNHPRIYRELLDEMGIDLPPTASRAFAQSQLLHDRSFELPVYWLSIGRFPRTFMPEILGLNLAMELSGVGGGYRRAKLNLSRHGFSTRFVDIHNTIDNVATGHAAWAADAVDTLIAGIGISHGREAQAATWERVRVGFVALEPPSGRRGRLAQRRAQRRALSAALAA